jgi:hypothetical protein
MNTNKNNNKKKTKREEIKELFYYYYIILGIWGVGKRGKKQMFCWNYSKNVCHILYKINKIT